MTKEEFAEKYGYNSILEMRGAQVDVREQLLIDLDSVIKALGLNDDGSNEVTFRCKEMPNFEEWIKTMFVKNDDLYKMFKSNNWIKIEDAIEIYNIMFNINH